MIDFFKGRFTKKNKIEELIRANKSLNLDAKFKVNDGSIEYPLKTNIENLRIKVYEGYASIENSIHTFYNNTNGGGIANSDDFGFCDLQFSLNTLEERLGYNLEDISLNVLEFGLNIDIGMKPSLFLDRYVLMHKLKTPCYNPKNNRKMRIKKFTYNEYEIKVYDKSLQFEGQLRSSNILRVEVKFKTKKQLNRLGIYTLNDLRRFDCIRVLYLDYFEKLSHLNIVDSYDGNRLMTKKQANELLSYTHPSYWIDTRGNFSTSTFQKRKSKFFKLVKKFNLDSWKNELFRFIKDKFTHLSYSDCETIDLPPFLMNDDYYYSDNVLIR